MAFRTPTYDGSVVTSENFADNETPSGDINGVNAVFTLDNAPSPASSLILVLNGQVQTDGVEFNLSGDTITFVSPIPVEFAGLPFKAWYRF